MPAFHAIDSVDTKDMAEEYFMDVPSCWINRENKHSYSLIEVDGDQITFEKWDGALVLTRSEALCLMYPT